MSLSARPPAASTITDDMSAPKSSVIDGRPGYVFGHGVDGLGYYPDANSNPNPNPNEQGSPIVQAPPASEVQVQMPPAVDTPHLASNNHSLTKSRALACAPGWLGRALVRFPGPLFVTFGLTVPICISCSVIIYPQLRRTEFHSASAALEPLQWTLAAGAIIFLALTNSVDPGVVTAEMAPAELKTEDDEHEGVTGATRVRGLRRKVHDVEYRWCDTCSVWRPPRASHCDLCQRCFLRFDHHCPWVGTCVAQYNHRFFAAFLIFAGAAGLTCFGALVLAAVDAGDASVRGVGFGFLVLFSCCSCWCFSGLSAFGAGALCMLLVDVTSKDIAEAKRRRTSPLRLHAVRDEAPFVAICCQPCEPRTH